MNSLCHSYASQPPAILLKPLNKATFSGHSLYKCTLALLSAKVKSFFIFSEFQSFILAYAGHSVKQIFVAVRIADKALQSAEGYMIINIYNAGGHLH